mgnify:CR=1 FL=1
MKTRVGKKVIALLLENEVEHEPIEENGFKAIEAEKSPSPELTPEEIFRIEEAKKKIEKVLLTLSPRQEKVVRMCIMDNKSFKEVSEELSMGEDLVKRTRIKAIRKLRRPESTSELRPFLP